MKAKFLIIVMTVVAMIACDNNESQKNEQETYIDNLISQSQNLETEGIHNNILGIWERNSMFVYDDNWQTIEETMLFKGDLHYMGLASIKYTFSADGKGRETAMSVVLGLEGTGESIVEFNWLYDVETHMLVLNNDNGYNVEYKLSALNNEYLVLDHYDSVNKHNIREIYKRIVE